MTPWAKNTLIIIIILALGVGTYVVWNGEVSDDTIIPPGTTSTNSDLIHITLPLPNALVQSPLMVTGEARGNWYFEASFPVHILDANGKELGVIPAQAQGDWMTAEFVPFVATLSFATSTTNTGTLVLKKDNPSDMREYDAEIRIPVRFK